MKDTPLNLLKEIVKGGGPVRMGGTTYYVRNGKFQACASKRAGQKNSTEKKIAINRHFAEVRTLWKMYRRAVGELPVWRVAAREAGAAKSDSLFHSLNGACVRPEEGWQVTLAWENDETQAAARKKDRIYVGYFYDTQPRVPQLAIVENARRQDGKATIDIPAQGQPAGTPLHLYLFFGTEKNDRFSPSVYCLAK